MCESLEIAFVLFFFRFPLSLFTTAPPAPFPLSFFTTAKPFYQFLGKRKR
jgi:hypothetical protein